MLRWRLLLGGCSVALVGWGAVAFADYIQSVGGNGDLRSGWMFVGLGVAGLATLRWSRFGYAAAIAHFAAAAFAAWWCVTALVIWRTAVVTNLGFIGPIVLSFAMPMLLLCSATVVSSLQLAFRTRRCT